MSNHVTATQSKIILIEYSDKVKTLINCQSYHVEPIVYKILNILIEEKEEIVSHIDNLLNSYGLSQCMLPQGSIILGPEENILINHPYDLGENETEQDVQKYYPNYRRKENE